MDIRRFGAVLLTSALPALAQQADTEHTLVVAGDTRTYLLHVPADAPTGPLPLVVVFHGGGGNARHGARVSGMDAKADKEKFIVAYPNGSGRMAGALLTWNTWQCCGYALDHHVDDVAFVRAMVADIARSRPVDRKRVFATGMSNGAMMTYRVGCEMADVFAAIAPVAGALDTDGCKPSAPVSLVVFHGKADEHVRFEGGVPIKSADRRHSRVDKPVSYAIDLWKRTDRCDAAPARDTKGSVTHEAYACGATSTAVALYAFDGQGHTWPASATDLMWDFFSHHPRK
jgi:polyhydroxybutyrate depolymerase